MGLPYRRSVRLLALLALTSGALAAPVTASATARTSRLAANPVSPLVIATTSLPQATIASTYSVPLTASGGLPPYGWSIAQGPVPAGLVLSSLGVLSGRPGSLGSVAIALKVTDSAGTVMTKTFTFTAVAPPPPPEELFSATSTGILTLTIAGASPAVLPTGSAATGSAQVTDVAADAAGTGAWVLTSRGAVIPVGSAVSYGSPAARHHGREVALAPDAAGSGYWVVSSAGHVSGFGSARSRGSVAQGQLSGRVVAIAASPHGLGYWLATSTGRVYAFGSAPRLGSLRRRALRGHIVGLVAAGGSGYWLASTSGDVYSFGSARSSHFAGAVKPNAPLAAIASAPSGVGYWLVTVSGAVFAYGTAEALPPSPALLVGSPVIAASGAP